MNLIKRAMPSISPARRLLAALVLAAAASVNTVHAAVSASLTHTVIAAAIVGTSALLLAGCTPINSGVVIVDGKRGITAVPADGAGIEVDPKGMIKESLPAIVPTGAPEPAPEQPKGDSSAPPGK